TPGVFSVSPAHVTLEGETDVLCQGRRFTEATTILFAGLPSPNVTLVSPEELRAVVPFDVRLEGFPEITVADRGGEIYSFASHLLEVSFVHPDFLRGDADGSGLLNITDPLKTLRYLFGQEDGSLCEDAMDSDDSGSVEVSDVILLLSYLFLEETRELAPPRGACGPDPTADSLLCIGPSACP